MALDTYSIFYFGLEIVGSGDGQNNLLNFLEPNAGNVELSAEIDPGTYNYQDFLAAIKTAMDAVGDETYTLTIDRISKKITVAGTDTFELLISSGSQIGTSPFSLMGFTGSVDLTGAASYEGDSESGQSYEPQFFLEDYTPSANFKRREDSAVNVAASGAVEVISFGLVGFFQMSFKFITDKTPQKVIKSNSSGVSNANNFFTEITKRGQFEFMPDINDRTTFSTVVLDSLDGDRRGTGYRLRELVGQNLPGYFEVNNVLLREIT
jgi:hypothetical protein